MPLFQTEVLICATVYVMADSKEAACEKVTQEHYSTIEIPQEHISESLEISGCKFGPDMPEISLSPSMTFYAAIPTLSALLNDKVTPDNFDQTEY